MAINNISQIKDTVLLVRDIISGTVADPISDRQAQSGDPGSNSRFVMTSFPQRAIVFPFITIGQVSLADVNLGMQTQDSLTRGLLQVDVWTKQVGQRDGIAGSVFYGLRNRQLGVGGLISSGIIDWRMTSNRNLDEEGKTGVHRASQTYEYSYVAGSP